MRSMRPYVPALILFTGCALLWKAHSQSAVPLARPLTTVLSAVDGYAVTDQRLSDDEQRVAGMTDYVARVYAKDSVVAFTTLVSYYDRQTQGRTIHSPRNCLPGAGWETVQRGVERISGADGMPAQIVNRYVLRNGRLTAVAYYWYQGRGRITASEYTVKWNLLRDAAIDGHTEEALVRIVVPISVVSASNPENALAEADVTARAVAQRMIQDVDSVLPARRRT